MKVYIVIKNYSTDEGTWESIVDVFSDETKAGVVALELDENREDDYTSFYVVIHDVID